MTVRCFSAVRLVLLLGALSAARVARADPATAVNVGAAKRVTWDDSLMDKMRGIRFEMHKPRRTGERCLIAREAWESWQIGGMHSVLREGKKFRMWYGVSHGVRNGEEYAIAYAESDDGIRWTKPVLDLVEYSGSKKNNLAVGYSSVIGQVFVDPNAPPAEKYKMLAAIYPLKKGDRKRYLTFLSSADGLRWSRPDKNVLPANAASKVALDTQSQAFWDPDLKKYLLYTRMGPWRQVGRSESTDPFRFPEPVYVMRPKNPVVADYYQSGVTRYEEAAHAYFALVPVFHHPGDAQGKPVGRNPALTINYAGNPLTVVAPDTVDLHLFTSHDSRSWRRHGDEDAFLGLGLDGGFDSRQIYSGVGYARVADEIWFYYSGFDVTHAGVLDGKQPFERRHGVISRATLRLDGFVSASAGPAGGEIVTRPLLFSGNRLDLNVDCGGSGHIDVELQSADGKPLAGFTLDDADRIYHNNVRKTVTWRGRSDLERLAGQPVRLRLAMRNCKLYAFQFPAAKKTRP